MASRKKQLVKFCRIFQWVEQEDPEFAQAIHDLCQEGILSSGVTFLYPKEAAYRRDIINDAYSDKAEDAVAAIQSLVVPEVLHSGLDFKKGVGSKLGVKFAVKSASEKKVELEGGVELVPSGDFSPLSSKAERIAVWLVTKGRLPLTGEAYHPPGRKESQPRLGGGIGDANRRRILAEKAEVAFNQCMIAKDTCDPYLAKVVGVLNFLKAKHSGLLATVLPVLDYDPVISFYLVFEPYKTSGEFLLSDAVIEDWHCSKAFSDPIREYEEFMRQAGAGHSDASRTRGSILSNTPAEIPKLVQNAYAGNIKKLWQDEFRFTVSDALFELRCRWNPAEFFGLVNDLRTSWCGNNYEKELVLTDLAKLRLNIGNRNDLLLLTRFVNSTDFLYSPVAPEEVGTSVGARSLTDPQLYNRNYCALECLRKSVVPAQSSGVSERVLKELEVYKALHGKLPDAVTAMVAAPAQQ